MCCHWPRLVEGFLLCLERKLACFVAGSWLVVILSASKLLARIRRLLFLVSKRQILQIQQYMNTCVLLKRYNDSDQFIKTAMVLYLDGEN